MNFLFEPSLSSRTDWIRYMDLSVEMVYSIISFGWYFVSMSPIA